MKWAPYATLLNDLHNGELTAVHYISQFRGAGYLEVERSSGQHYRVALLQPPDAPLFETLKNAQVAFGCKLPLMERWKGWVLGPAWRWWSWFSQLYLWIQLVSLLILASIVTVSRADSPLYDPQTPLGKSLILPTSTLKELELLLDLEEHRLALESLGARPRKGILFVGPPGTGKTLTAKSLAERTGKTFIAIGGSSLTNNQYVGSGAKMVRELFQEARSKAPTLLFIDELDSIGISRQKLRQALSRQTLNELLNQLDGAIELEGVTVVAATNRPEDLDEALLRPGRFDFKVQFLLPNLEERKKLLNLYLNKVKLPKVDIEVEKLAELSDGFSGADIASWIQAASQIALRKGAKELLASDCNQAFFRKKLGTRQDVPNDEEDAQLVAYHEGGHLLLSWLLVENSRSSPSVYVSILPGSSFGGLTYLQHDSSNPFWHEQELRNKICIGYGGRAGEMILQGKERGKNAGAQGDFSQAIVLARLALASYSPAKAVGCMPELATQLPSSCNVDLWCSSQRSQAIHEALTALVEAEAERATRLLEKNSDTLKAFAELLLEKKSLFHQDLVAFFEAHPLVGEPSDLHEGAATFELQKSLEDFKASQLNNEDPAHG